MFSQLGDKLQDIFKDLRGHGALTESNISDTMRQVRMALLEADVHFQVAKDFVARVKDKALGADVIRSITPGQQIVKIFHDELTALLGGDAAPLDLTRPARILVVGLNGAGKTTSSAKLALHLRTKQNRQAALIACDLLRPAAIDQLATLAGQVGVPVFKPKPGETDVLKVARDAQGLARPAKRGQRRRFTTPRAGRKSTSRSCRSSSGCATISSRRRCCWSATPPPASRRSAWRNIFTPRSA